MGFNVGSITGTIDLDAGPALRAERSVVEGAVNVKSVVESSGAQAAKSFASSWKESLGNIKSEFGKSSLLGQGLKLAMGGGAIAGVGMALREFEGLTEAVSKTADALRRGELNGRDAAAEMVREVPILGTMVKSFDNLREAITGEKYALELVNAEATLTNKYFDDQLATVKNLKSTMVEYAGEIARAKGIVAEATTDDSLAKQVIALRTAQESQWGQDKSKLAERVQSQQAANRKLVDDQVKIVENLKQQFKRNYSNADPDLDPLNDYRIAGPGGILKGTSGYKKLADMMQADLTVIDTAEKRKQSIAADGERALEKIRETAKNAALANDAAFNSQILEAQRTTGKKLQEEALKESSSLSIQTRIAESWFKDVREGWMVGPPASLALNEKEKDTKDPIWKMLPNASMAAMEIFGPHIVTSADLPSNYFEVIDGTKETAKNTAEATRILHSIDTKLGGSPSGPSMSGVTIDVIGSSSW